MPVAREWTDDLDRRLLAMREDRQSWHAVAAALGMNRSTVIERARRIGIEAKRPGEQMPTMSRMPRRSDAPLPAGHIISWGAIQTLTPSLTI